MSKADKKAKVTAGMYDAVVSPVITEKSQMGVEFNKVTFVVAAWATKPQVKAAVETLFETKVEKVNIINVKGKVKRFRGTIGKRSNVKKAVVTLAEGQTIDVAATA
ncbi:MAG: 50S ribosomal protein L23 [Alphaproteobacteria bacterium CG11_big_fil_rev_8_21_14_0_20_39_49]|nr:MAG: 50S ribosomal protein L23 [Alphaproteobacteria bacterium CG11_big_fil_rev_8_21_14_0_20_39_49]